MASGCTACVVIVDPFGRFERQSILRVSQELEWRIQQDF